MEDPLRKRIAASLIMKLADPQAPLALPDAYYDLRHFIEKAKEFMDDHRRTMPDSVRVRFEKAVEHARLLLDGVEVIEEWHLPHDDCGGSHRVTIVDDSNNNDENS